jgi:hypothetical protein
MYGVLWASPNTVSGVRRAERMEHRVENGNWLGYCITLCVLPFDSTSMCFLRSWVIVMTVPNPDNS